MINNFNTKKASCFVTTLKREKNPFTFFSLVGLENDKYANPEHH